MKLWYFFPNIDISDDMCLCRYSLKEILKFFLMEAKKAFLFLTGGMVLIYLASWFPSVVNGLWLIIVKMVAFIVEMAAAICILPPVLFDR